MLSRELFNIAPTHFTFVSDVAFYAARDVLYRCELPHGAPESVYAFGFFGLSSLRAIDGHCVAGTCDGWLRVFSADGLPVSAQQLGFGVVKGITRGLGAAVFVQVTGYLLLFRDLVGRPTEFERAAIATSDLLIFVANDGRLAVLCEAVGMVWAAYPALEQRSDPLDVYDLPQHDGSVVRAEPGRRQFSYAGIVYQPCIQYCLVTVARDGRIVVSGHYGQPRWMRRNVLLTSGFVSSDLRYITSERRRDSAIGNLGWPTQLAHSLRDDRVHRVLTICSGHAPPTARR